MNTADELRKSIQEMTTVWWALTTLATAVEAGLLDAVLEPASSEDAARRCAADAVLVESMLDVLGAVGFVHRHGATYCAAPALIAQLQGEARAAWISDLRSTLLQGQAFFASGRQKALSRGWTFVEPAILEAQGANSAQFVEVFLSELAPLLVGLRESLERGALFLDVGCGVASICIELCRRSPVLRCVGLEPAYAALQIARTSVMAAGLADRIELRAQRVEQLEDRDVFDLAWLPAVFMPEPTLSAGIERVRNALRPGAWAMTMVMAAPGASLPAALGRLRNVMWGGDRMTEKEMQDKLRTSGFVGVQAHVLPSGNTKILAARKPLGAP
jgi:SAM-dependent methyltransferase